jgi:DNA polymerase III sliding clamp (beta) subunit (PCNA family)
MIGFEGAGRRLTTRLLGGEFLKYSSRFPAEFGSRAELAPGPLIEAVRRVALVAERGSPVRLAFGDGEVVIEAGSQGQARAVERVPAVFAGDERVIAFSPHYLLDGLTAAATPSSAGPAAATPGEEGEEAGSAASGRMGPPDRIRLEFTSAVRPAVITGVLNGENGSKALNGENGSKAPAEPAARSDSGIPDFRYLVVPLRMPGSS